MATFTLADGRTVPVVTPNLGDQMELERQMRTTRKKYGPADFREDMKLSGFQTAFAVWASFRRADVQASIQEVLELDFNELQSKLTGGPNDDLDDLESESEGEQTPDPYSAPTVAAPAE